MSSNYFAFWYECLVKFFLTLKTNIAATLFIFLMVIIIHGSYFIADKILKVDFLELIVFSVFILIPLVMLASSFALNFVKFSNYTLGNLISKSFLTLKNFCRFQISAASMLIILIILLEKTPELINSIPVIPSFGYVQDFLKLFGIIALLFGFYFLLFRFIFILLIVSERRVSTLDSLKLSDNMSNGHKMILYIFYVLVCMIPSLFISSLNLINSESVLIFRSLFDLMFIGMVITGFDKLRTYKHINAVN